MPAGAEDEHRRRRSAVFDAMPLAVLGVDLSGRVIEGNEALGRLLGQPAGCLAGRPAVELFAPPDRHLVELEVAAMQTGRRRGRSTCRLVTATGAERWVRLDWQLNRPEQDEAWILAFLHDVELEARAALVSDELLAAVEAERATLTAALDSSPDGISIFTAQRDASGEVVDALLVRINQAGAGPHPVHDLAGRTLREFFPEAEETGLHAALLAAFSTQQPQRVVVEVSEGSPWAGVHDNVIAPIDADRVLCTFRDVTRERRDEQRLLHAATHDALTGLPNRVLLRDRIEHALQRAARDGGAATIAFLDLDGFKTINDTRGHTYGDEVLRQVSSRLTGSVRDGDTVARLGGDEFVLVLEGCADEREWLRVHRRVTRALGAPLVVGGHLVTLRASIGVVFTSPGETDADAVMRNADIAMYASKNSGKAMYTVFTEQHRREVLDLATLESDLERAVEQGQFELYSQPIRDLRLGLTVGHEVLLRWRHPDRGVLLPAAFLPALESAGRMVEVGGWVLLEALRQAAARCEAGDAGLVTVNVSVQQLVRSDFVRTVREALLETGMSARTLTVEITESQMLPSRGSVLGQLKELRKLGVRVAVDDFGTGYSSLSHLADLPVDLVKIDRSFLVDVSDSRREAVLRSAVELTTAVGAECLVEGVETAEQLELVHATGARFAQGFLLGRPAPYER